MLLNREGWNAGKYLVYRLYKEEGLTLKKRPQRKRKAVRHREEKFVATAPNQAWSLDFVADQLQDGRRFRALTIVDVLHARERGRRGGTNSERRRRDANSEPAEVRRSRAEVVVL